MRLLRRPGSPYHVIFANQQIIIGDSNEDSIDELFDQLDALGVGMNIHDSVFLDVGSSAGIPTFIAAERCHAAFGIERDSARFSVSLTSE